MTEVLLSLLMWLNANSHFTYNNQELPEVYEVTREQMTSLFMGKADFQREKLAGHKVQALYDRYSNRIYVLNGFDPKKPEHKATLLHELVHYMQSSEGYFEHLLCENRAEWDAYELEIEFLKATAEISERELVRRKQTALFSSRCRSDAHF